MSAAAFRQNEIAKTCAVTRFSAWLPLNAINPIRVPVSNMVARVNRSPAQISPDVINNPLNKSIAKRPCRKPRESTSITPPAIAGASNPDIKTLANPAGPFGTV